MWWWSCPPLSITDAEIDTIAATLVAAITEVADSDGEADGDEA